MKIFLTSLFILVGITSNSQAGLICSHHKIAHAENERSATLSLEYISLTQEYDVNFYFLDINVQRTSTDISGSAEIHVKVNAAVLDTFLFELHEDLNISDILLNGITSQAYTREGSAVIVPVSFVADDEFYMEIIYDGTPPTSGGGALGGDGLSNGSSGSWGNQATWSLSEPFSAYEWFPCKQYLGDKADSVWVFITTDSENMAGSQGILTDVVDVGGGMSRYEWKSNYPIAYYLISVSVAKYVEYSFYANPTGASGPILIQNFIYDNPSTLPFFKSEIDKTADMMEHYSDLFGLYPFELEKYGHCMAPFSGGMEHQTMTTQGFFFTGLTAHEIAHQWFGDNVTCESWADIWVNEGFASYSEELYFELYEPGEEVSSMIARHDDIMSEADGAVWVEDSLNPSRIFDGRLTYNKGAAIIHTLRFLIDDDPTFFQILQDYQTIYKDDVARGVDFKAVAESVSGKDFTNFFNEWYFGEGYPSYSGFYNQIGNNVWLDLNMSCSASSVTPLFTNDLEVKIVGTSGLEKVVRLSGIDASSTLHSFTFTEPIDYFEIDPNNWIINGTGIFVEDITVTGLSSEDKETVVYPNPAADQIFVDFGFENSIYQIIASSGKVVQSGLLNQGKNNIDLHDLPCGTYFLKHQGGVEKFLIN